MWKRKSGRTNGVGFRDQTHTDRLYEDIQHMKKVESRNEEDYGIGLFDWRSLQNKRMSWLGPVGISSSPLAISLDLVIDKVSALIAICNRHFYISEKKNWISAKSVQYQKGHPKVYKVSLRSAKPIQGHPKVIPRSSQGHPKVIQRSSKGHPKVIQRSFQGHPKVS